MSASAVFILDHQGKVLIGRNYRGDVDMTAISCFMPILNELEDVDRLSPIIRHKGLHFMHIKHNDVYFVAVSKINTNVTLVLTFLIRIAKVFEEYFKSLEEESIRDNFVIIYELFDEFMDFGLPQTTDPNILTDLITQKSNKLQQFVSQAPVTLTGQTPWRPPNITHKKNEVYIDVIESLDLLVSATGSIIRSEVSGTINMRVFLTGMPELKLGINDRIVAQSIGKKNGRSIDMEDVKFHQCVRLSRFQNDRTISFIPPDGEFDLMTYRITAEVKPLIWVESIVEKHEHSRIEYAVRLKSQFKSQCTARDIDVLIPVPADVASPKFQTTVGTCQYSAEKQAMVWRIASLPGSKEFLLRAHFSLSSITAEEPEAKTPPIRVQFEIPYFTVSGIRVRYLKISEKSGYNAMPWVRYITKNGDYQLRTQ